MATQSKIWVLRGIPASGKSTWAKEEVAKDPLNSLRISNDDLRAAFNGSEWSSDYEKIITATREFLIEKALKSDKHTIILDNLNLGKQHFPKTCEIAKRCNVDAQVIEKLFYLPVEEALERNSKREGKARLDDKVILKWWKESGKEMGKHYHPRIEIFTKQAHSQLSWAPLEQDMSLPQAIICDLDGTLARIGDRSPYDASRSDETDTPHDHIVEAVRLHYQAGYKVIFCSGRMEKDRAASVRFIERCLPGMPYELLMRKDADMRKDAIVKEEIFNASIKGKYWVRLVFDDRISVCRLWHSLGLNLLRAGDPDADY